MKATVGSGDQAEISGLLCRYYRAVDDKRVDHTIVEATFTADGRWVSPTGIARVGHEEIAVQQIEAIALFRATHHMTTDHIVELDGDAARLQANVTAMHLWASGTTDPATLESHFLAGGVFQAHAVRTSAGWRFSELILRIVWRTGALPVHVSPDKV
ncbi:nuclear transport factor 2 family protein [Nocardia sp. NPDC050710]|uniref:nuclear transport factor 2 family protein n=1 Tax=Nocardia sp. NPDC050710 TaxID=3157220 RepID=UPI00340FFF29